MPSPRVLFIHGLESSPQGAKARLFAEHFEALTPAMDTSDFEACVAVQAAAIRRFTPDVVVGSSFGGGVALALLQRGLWRGPTLLLAQAAFWQPIPRELPDGVRVWLVHGTRDEVVPIDDSRRLARTGSRELVRLIEVDDDHPLSGLVRSGRLVELVRDLAAAQDAAPASGFGRHLAAFIDEPMLWPVLIVVAAHVVLFGALLLLLSFRSRSPFALAGLALALVASADAVRRELAGGRFGLVGRSTLGIWLLSAVTAVTAAWFGVF
jgi:pimeloyl-ACP methyl ester carboxylesterase